MLLGSYDDAVEWTGWMVQAYVVCLLCLLVSALVASLEFVPKNFFTFKMRKLIEEKYCCPRLVTLGVQM